MLSRTAVLAIKALAALAALPERQCAGATHIAQQIGAPENYLGKLLQLLSHAGLVCSQKGLKGGFRLAKAPEKISLMDIAEPIDHVSRWNGCFMGGVCCQPGPCPLHEKWATVRSQYASFLSTTTIAEVAGKAVCEGDLLTPIEGGKSE